MTTATLERQPGITGGVDAHKNTHHAIASDYRGVRLGDREFPTTATGYQCLLDWLSGFERIGVESTGTYAAGLTRHLTVAGVRVVEVNTAHSHTRARQGKDDVIDGAV